jgi:hypothetical protein
LGSKVIKVVLRCPKLKTWPLKMASRAMRQTIALSTQKKLHSEAKTIQGINK